VCAIDWCRYNGIVKRRQAHVAALRAQGRMQLEDYGFAGCVLSGHTGHFKNFMGLYVVYLFLFYFILF
jgi:hypothetical protein